MAHGSEHVGAGTPHLFHTFQRRTNRAPAIILEGSLGRTETGVKGKSFMVPNSIESMGSAHDSTPQSETSRYSTTSLLCWGNFETFREISGIFGSKTMNGRPSRPARTRPELSRAPAEATRARKSHFGTMTHGPELFGTGTLHFFHTFQRRSN